jgi:hypothetical protein
MQFNGKTLFVTGGTGFIGIGGGPLFAGRDRRSRSQHRQVDICRECQLDLAALQP